jgi:hypothetical protein
VAVQIQYQLNLLFLGDLANVILYQTDLRLPYWVGLQPTSVEVKTGKVTPVITEPHSVYIHHGEYVDIEPPNQKLHFFRILQQLKHHLFPDERSWCLPGVLPA